MNQEDRIGSLLEERGDQGLTPLEALDLAGCLRLAAVVHRMKEHLNPEAEIVNVGYTTPSGKHVARYVLRRREMPRGVVQATLFADL